MSTKFKGVVFIRRDSLDFATTQKPEVLRVLFTSDMVLDLEVIDEDKLKAAIASVLEKEKISPAHCLIVLGNSLIFSKQLTGKTPEEQENEIKEYLKIVPFEKVSSKTIKTGKESVVLAVNKNYYNNVRSILTSIGHSVSAVTHQSLFSKEIPSESPLNANQAKVLISWVDSVKAADNFLDQPAPVKSESEQLLVTEPKKKKSRLPLLLPVFGVLVIILVALYLSQQNEQKTYVAKAENHPKVLPTFTPTPTLIPRTPVGSASAVLAESADIIIRIMNGSGISGQAEKTKQKFSDLGFKNISTGNALSRTQSKTIVIFAKSVPNDVKNLITNTLKQNYTAIVTQETQSAEYPVIITLGSPSPSLTLTP